MLLIHGLLGGSFCWRRNLPILAKNHTVNAVDLPGLAFSDEPGIDCSMSCQANRLLDFIERSDLRDLIVMGCSFGGGIAMMLAAGTRGSNRIRSLVLCSPVNPWSNFGQKRIRMFGTRLGGHFLRAALPLSRPFHGIGVRRVFGDPKRMPADAVEGYRKSILRRGRAGNVLTVLRSWQRDLDSLREAIPLIKIPSLLVWGDRDPVVDPRSALELQRHLADAQLKFIPGAGHLAFEERPEEFNRLVLEFLGSGRP